MNFLIMILLIIAIPTGIFTMFYKTIKFVFAPLNEDNIDITEIPNNEIIEDKPTKVIIKDNNIDTSRIKEYEGDIIQKFEFRPQTWSQFIAQDKAKERAKTIIKVGEKDKGLSSKTGQPLELVPLTNTGKLLGEGSILPLNVLSLLFLEGFVYHLLLTLLRIR